ncbi:hypothetical protein [Desertimonas flava]|uniref:hypothetical protein n=1 Tax=Desertimonas flava TaxID=2064846 RepID=UPI000E344FC5|nr:hypothetical protein [Desertimonas flava]
MSGRFVGFDPARVTTLSIHTAAAVEHLRGVRTADLAALAALTRIGHVRFELETLWMPAIARVTGDQSMIGWSAAEPGPPPTPWDQLVASASAESDRPATDDPPSEGYLDEDHSDLTATLRPDMPATTTGTEWGALSPWQQEWLLVNQPDVVMAYMLRHGNVLTAEQLDELERANGFAEFSETFLATFGVEVGVRWIAIDLGSSSELRLSYMSDGTVEAVVTQKDSLGLVVDAGEIEIGAGVYVVAGQRLVFADEEEAQQAVDTLIAASNVSLADQGRRIANGMLFDDWRTDVQKKVDQLWDDHGVEDTDEVGVYVSAHGEISGALAISGDAALEAGVYTSTDADGNATRQGVRVAGSISGSVTEDGSTATGSASAVVDVHRELSTGEEFVTVTIAARGGGGVSSSIAPVTGSGVDVSSSATRSTVVTTTVTVPIDHDTAGNAGEMIEGVLSGELPVNAIEALYDDADITITIDVVSSETVGETTDGGAVEVESSYSVSQGRNVATFHKSPHGEMYSQNDLDAVIDSVRGASGLPVDGSGSGEAGGGTVSWDDTSPN